MQASRLRDGSIEGKAAVPNSKGCVPMTDVANSSKIEVQKNDDKNMAHALMGPAAVACRVQCPTGAAEVAVSVRPSPARTSGCNKSFDYLRLPG